MKIQVDMLNEGESLALSHAYNPVHENVQFDDCSFTTDIVFTGSALKEAGCVFVNGTVRATISRTCSRCLVAVEEPFTRDVSYTLECAADEIDITEEIRESLIFDHPIQFICMNSCKGLCPTCGKNLNEGACACNSYTEDNVFAKLKERLKKEEN